MLYVSKPQPAGARFQTRLQRCYLRADGCTATALAAACFHADDRVIIAFSLVFKATTGRFRFLSMLSRSFNLLRRLSALSWEYHRIETVALDKGCLGNICLACMSLTLDKQNTDLDWISHPSRRLSAAPL